MVHLVGTVHFRGDAGTIAGGKRLTGKLGLLCQLVHVCDGLVQRTREQFALKRLVCIWYPLVDSRLWLESNKPGVQLQVIHFASWLVDL
jgi:hypothetical protein